MKGCILALAALTRLGHAVWPSEVTPYFFDVPLDHFDSLGSTSDSFPLRYLVQTKYWDFEDGPILFYTGNEGDINNFFKNTQFVTTTLAEELNALVVFGEHRYFGESFPTQFSKTDAFKQPNVNYLTVEQVLADYNDLIKHVKYTYQANNSAVIAFGGSYGGMLSGWMRQHFPQTIQGAVAASAPSLYFKGVTPEEAFFTKTSQTFSEAGKTPGHCNLVLKEAFNQLKYVQNNLENAESLVGLLNLCTDFETGTPKTADDISDIYDHFSSALQYMAMTDYPEEATFLEHMPAYPVHYACDKISDVSYSVPTQSTPLNADQ